MNGNEVSVMFDMRAPAFGAPITKLYDAMLEMSAFADEIGVSRIGVMEHHGSEDGYLPAPFVLAGGVAARTKRARISITAVILPLHDPVKVAEQIAVLDIMSGGRLEVVLAAGYVPSEFQMFNVSLKHRGRLMDEGTDIIMRALRGERFAAGGREIFIRPLPLQQPEDIVILGGGVEASARRAARAGAGFSPLRADLFAVYDAECAKLGKPPGRKYSSGLPLSIHITEDPDRAWAQVGPHAVHVCKAYADWAAQEEVSNSPFAGLDNEAIIRASGLFVCWTPDEVVANAPAVLANFGGLNFMPLLGGLAPELGWESLELLKAKVMPRLAPLLAGS